jgi:hypothetical protein
VLSDEQVRTIGDAVLLGVLTEPFFHVGTDALMDGKIAKAVASYLLGAVPLCFALIVLGVISIGPLTTPAIRQWLHPVVTNPHIWLALWFFFVCWLAGPRYVERMRTAWNAKPQQRQYDLGELAMSKKQIPPPSPEKVEAIRAMASALDSRPIGEEAPKKIVAQPAQAQPPVQTKHLAKLSKETERTIAMAREIDRQSAEREAARRAFNALSPTRPMTDFEEKEWLRLDVLYAVHVETIDSKELRYLTLKFLPDRRPEDAFSLLLILYGYRQIYRWQDVGAGGLEECLYLSNVRKRLTTLDMIAGRSPLFDSHADRLNVDDIAKSPALRELVSEKIHLAKGGFYQLTDRGFATAQDLFGDLVRRA